MDSLLLEIQKEKEIEMDSQLLEIQKEIESMPLFIKLAIAEYTDHVEINRALRKAKILPINLEPLLNALDLAFSLVTPLKNDLIVYRGIHNTSTFYPEDMGFVSTAEDIRITEGFSGKNCCTLIIKVPKGSSVLRIPGSIGNCGDEKEVLLYRGAQFKLSDKNIYSESRIKSYTLDYTQSRLQRYSASRLTELKKYMNMNKIFRGFFDTKDVSSFEKFLTSENCELMFRCMLGNIFMYDDIELFFEVILKKFPDVVNQISGLSEYLKGDLDMDVKIALLYEFEYNKRPRWQQLGIQYSHKYFGYKLFIKHCKNGDLDRVIATYKKFEIDPITIELAFEELSKGGHLEVIRFLVEHGADVRANNSDATINAAKNGNLELVKFLVESGADVTAKDNRALYEASRNGYLEIVKFLVENGADVTANDNLTIIAALRDNHFEIVKFLVEHGAKSSYAIRRAAELGLIELVKFLVEHGYHVTNGDGALTSASKNGHLEVVKFLVEHGADVTNPETFALVDASNNSHLEVVKFLVEHGADVTVFDNLALKSAVEGGHLEVVKFLVEHGADINAVRNYALRKAAKDGHLEMVEYLTQKLTKI
jgi:ankyrin repeat protein